MGEHYLKYNVIQRARLKIHKVKPLVNSHMKFCFCSWITAFDFLTIIYNLTHIAAKTAKKQKKRLITRKVINKSIFTVF